MKKLFVTLCALSMTAAAVFGTSALAEEEETKTIVDHAGVSVEIPTEINRVVLGSTYPLASVLTTYLNSAEKIVGIHPVSMSAAENGLLGQMYPEILEAETGFINGSEVNIEELLKLEPDIVIGVGAEQAEAIRNAGIPAVTVSAGLWDYDILETYNQWIAIFDEIFGGSEYADEVISRSQEVYDEIQEKTSSLTEEEKPKVLIIFQYNENTLTVSGPNFFGEFWATASGGVNAAEALEGQGSIEVNMEQIYEWDPDIIVITNFTGTQPEDLYNNAINGDDWSQISAVQNEKVYKMPLGIYRSYTPGADTPVTLQWFAQIVHPELYEDVDIQQVARDYYSEVFDFDVTDEQLTMMFEPARESAGGLE